MISSDVRLLLSGNSFKRRVTPGECGFRQATEPQGPTAQLQNSLRTRNQHHLRPFASPGSPFGDIVRELVAIGPKPREMPGQQETSPLDSLHDRLGKSFALKAGAHFFDQLLPEVRATFLMDSLISDHGELLRPRDDEDEDSVALRRFVHSELEKPLFRKRQGIALQFSTLYENANLAGGDRLGCRDRRADALVLETGHELFRAHDQFTNWILHRRHQSCHRLR